MSQDWGRSSNYITLVAAAKVTGVLLTKNISQERERSIIILIFLVIVGFFPQKKFFSPVVPCWGLFVKGINDK